MERKVEEGKLGRRGDGRTHNAQCKESAMNCATVQINPDLYQRVKKFIDATHAFEDVNEYVNFILETLFLPEEQMLSSKDQERLSERLKALGYLD